MAKQGQHNDDASDKDKSKGSNWSDKSVTITTGSPKKHETYQEQARQGEDTGKQAQAKKNEWNEDTRDKPTIEGSVRARSGDMSMSGRANSSGSDSNSDTSSRGY